MCGLAGFASTAPFLDGTQLSSIGDVLSHRGPDDADTKLWNHAGTTIEEGRGEVGLTHRRLSILDLSPAGCQPMSNESGSVWIVYNGEFYNHRQYVSQLKSKNHKFRSRTDTEVLLHLYEEYGIEETLRRMNGMFAFALWDSRLRKLFLARDRVGKKPLYYMNLSDGSLVFASEIKAFEEAGLLDRNDIDLEALHQFWIYGYATWDRTMYASVKKLPPGHYAVWEQGQLNIREYWDCPFIAEPDERPINELVDELEALLCDAIRIRLVADVPVGLFLSGGIDSSLICALTAKVAGTDIRTFTIEFNDNNFNEAPYAYAISRHLGLPNTTLPVTDDLKAHFTDIARHFDEPFGDSSSIPTYFVSKLARKHVTVALTGDAGDELFAGYDAYAKGLRLWGTLTQRWLFSKNTPLPNLILDAPMMLLAKKKRLIELEKIVPDRIRKKILSNSAYRGLDIEGIYKQRYQWLSRVQKCDLLSRMQYLNIRSYLPDDILVKVDRMSMAHGLECRSPFLDYRVVEFATRLPYEAKIDKNGKQKHVLRRLLKRYIPEKLFNRPKAGFCIPWANWCQGGLGTTLRRRWRAMKSPFFNPKAAEFLFPKNKLGWSGRQWNAFVTMLFLDQ